MAQTAAKTVMAFGTFDIFHEGHQYYLNQAKQLGTSLIVVIARDRTTTHIKGEAPLHSETERLNAVKQSGIATKVLLGNLDDKYKVIKKYRPDIIALGYDQMVFTQQLKKILIDYKLNTEIVRLDAYFPQVFKSSLIKQRNAENSSTESHSDTTSAEEVTSAMTINSIK